MTLPDIYIYCIILYCIEDFKYYMVFCHLTIYHCKFLLGWS